MIPTLNRFGSLTAIAVVLASGCDSSADDDGAETVAGTTNASSGDDTTTEGSSDGASADSSTASPSGSSSSGGDQQVAGPETCAAQGDAESCAAVASFVAGEGGPADRDYCNEDGEPCECAWRQLWPVTLDGEVCGYGEPRGRCMLMDYPEAGCSGEVCSGTETFAVYSVDDDGVYVGQGAGCGDPGEGEAYCGTEDAPAECACSCDDGFPG